MVNPQADAKAGSGKNVRKTTPDLGQHSAGVQYARVRHGRTTNAPLDGVSDADAARFSGAGRNPAPTEACAAPAACARVHPARGYEPGARPRERQRPIEPTGLRFGKGKFSAVRR